MEIIFIIGAVVMAVYAFCNLHLAKKQEFVQCVEAGPTKKITAKFLEEQSFYAQRQIIKDQNGKDIDTSEMLRICVNGNCMKPKHIVTGSQLLVKKIDKNKPIKEQIKQGDILLIHLEDNNIHKIRIFDKYQENHLLSTYRYDDDGKRKDSSNPHRESSVVGVVKYKI